MYSTRSIALALFATGGIVATANADLRVWTGAAGDNNWSNNLNWSGNQRPGSQDTAYIDPGFDTIFAPFGTSVGTVVSYRPIVFQNSIFIGNTSHFYADVAFNGGLTIGRSDAVIHVFRTCNWNGGNFWPNTGTSNTTIQINSGATMNIGPSAGSLANNVAVMTGGTLNLNTTSLYFQNFSAFDIVVMSTQPGASINFNAGTSVGTTQNRPSAGAVINYGNLTTRNGPTYFADSVYFFNSGKIRTESNTYIGDPAFLPPGDNYIAGGEYELINSSLTFSPGRPVKGISSATRLTISGPNAYFGGLGYAQNNEGVLTISDGAYPGVGYSRPLGFNNYGTINLMPNGYLYSDTQFTNAPSGRINSYVQGVNYGDFGYIVSAQYFNLLGGTAHFISQGYLPAHNDRFPLARVIEASPYYGAYGAFSAIEGSGWASWTVYPTVQDSHHAFDYVFACTADFNSDGFLDGFDYDDFVACFEGSGCPGTKSADFNGDGFADGFDYDDFVAAFEIGC